ncbi:peptidylprolyl isomerase [Wielerella bovis]|uniref:peptidylprolyl isomerase n=1 Tax=Wielerella bovis TaxID=2917790 RepID=UPI002019A9CD|nr:peptidyl-prolyl cis-trans isomerase [Wielerella bovis]MCG7656539.1 peptidyl-prolyl cis-trans isomerase [Wielerella bovis]MCG7658764.1 peptidyl-prolyl cis-trans isomerase [Wielerella bovis]
MNKKRIAATLLTVLFSGSVWAETVVTVNGSKIDSSELDRRVKLTVAASQGKVHDSPDLRRFIAQATVLETVVVQEAKRLRLDKSDAYKAAETAARKQATEQGLDKQADFKQRWADFQNQLLMQAYEADVIQKNPVSDVDIQTRYEQLHRRYNGTDEVQVGEIVTDKAEQATAAARELGAKKSFADVAKKYSIDPSVKAGQLPITEFVSLVDMKEARPKIYDAVSSLKKGQASKPIAGDNIHVVFYMQDRRKITVDSLDKMRDSMRESMTDERVQEAVNTLMQKAKIEPAK